MKKIKQVAVKQIDEQENALDSYLATMLAEIPATEVIEKREQKVIKQVQVEVTPEVVKFEKQEKVIELVKVEDKAEKVEVNALSVMPEYAGGEFSALLFKVGNLILAAPLTDLSRAIKFDCKLTKIPQQPIWFMGLMEEQGLKQKIGVLNMAYLIQGKNKASTRDYKQQKLSNIILTEDSKWGLACDELLSIAKFSTENVRWRTDRTKRPWLVGTVIEQLVVIVDINELIPRRKSASNA